MVSSRAQGRLRTAHRSTLLALLGVGLIALGIVLTLTRGVGDVVPTVLALVGAVVLVAGISTGMRLVWENARWSRDQSYYDPDDERDE
jgi:uncharacterized membrane protein